MLSSLNTECVSFISRLYIFYVLLDVVKLLVKSVVAAVQQFSSIHPSHVDLLAPEIEI